jgi:polysaccharide export outer membrane protein
VQEAISIGGGLSQLGSEWRIRIKRKAANGQTIEVPASLDDQVEAGDIIVVNERIF